jgi:hypothetical protein
MKSESDVIRPSAPAIISAQVLTTLHQIGGGWTAARITYFTSLLQRGELLYSLVIDDGDEVYFGCTAPHMQINIASVREAASKSASLVIVVEDLGFGKEEQMGSILNPMQRHNMKQNVKTLTSSEMVTIQGNLNNVHAHTGSNADGYPIVELCAMEAKLNTELSH